MSLADQAKAARLYVQAKAAVLDNQLLLAATHFEEALQVDPTAPDVIAGYARVLARLGNNAKANALYERLLAIDPTRPEALLTVGLQAANRADIDGTIRALAPLLVEPPLLAEGDVDVDAARARLESFWSSLREDAILAVELSLARALNESGADRALLEVLDRSFARGAEGGPALAGWPAMECRRIAGDARARRGDIGGALRDWKVALAQLESETGEDLSLPPLVARVVWAERALAMAAEGEASAPASQAAVSTLRSMVLANHAGGGPRDEWIALAAWLASTTVAGTEADDELRAFASSVDVRVGDPQSARLAAALAPKGAVARLAASHDRRRPDAAHVAAWLRAAHEEGKPGAVAVAGVLFADSQLEPELVISALLACGLDASTLLAQTAEAAGKGAPRSIALHMRVLSGYGRTAEAWAIGNEALPKAKDPEGRSMILRALLAVAASAKRVEAIPDLAASLRRDDLFDAIELLRTWAAFGDVERVKEVGERAESIARDNDRARAIARGTIASVVAADAARARDRAKVTEALDALRVAVAADRSYELGWLQLLAVTRALHPSEGRREPSDEERAVRTELFDAIPHSTLAFGLQREALMAQGRSGDALEALIARTASNTADEALLRESVAALSNGGRVAEALAILDERIAAAPAHPLAWRLWTETSVAAGQAEAALERLSRAFDEGGDDPITGPLRAMPLRALGRIAEADAIDEMVLGRQMPSARREIARIASFIEGQRFAEAVAGLDALASMRTDLAAPEAFAGLELAIRLEPGREPDEDRRRLIRSFAQDLLDRAEDPERAGGMEPAAVVRAAGAMALVTCDAARPDLNADERAALATRALAAQASIREAMDPKAASVWLDLAQRFADERLFAQGSDFLRALATSELRMQPAVAARITTACFALDAAAGGRADRAIALLDLVRSRGVRPFAGRDRKVDRDADELYLLASLFSLVHDLEGSRTILTESLRRDPSHGMSLNNLGWDRLDRGEMGADVVAMLEAAYAALPNDPSVLDSIGWLRYKQGRFAEAMDLLGKALTASGDDPSIEVVDHFGDAAWRHGERDAARNAWREVQSLAERFYARETILGRLPTYETNEHGVRVIDGEKLWQRSYGDAIERAARKLKAADEGAEPPVAPVATGVPVTPESERPAGATPPPSKGDSTR